MPMSQSDNHLKDTDSLIVFADDGADIEAAEHLAKHLDANLTQDKSQLKQTDLVLRVGAEDIVLMGGELSVRGDFTHMLPRLKRENLQRELLVRAAKLKGDMETPTAIDATAGLGDDALLLAAAGFKVRLYEYDPVIAALLRDAIGRASKIPELAEIVSRMELCEADSIAEMPKVEESPYLILLDPMFPDKRKSALTKKKFQLIHRLKSPCADEDELMSSAIAARPCKIVVKRPVKGPYLAGIKPTFSLTGKAVRYDCIVFPHNYADKNI